MNPIVAELKAASADELIESALQVSRADGAIVAATMRLKRSTEILTVVLIVLTVILIILTIALLRHA